MPKPERADSKTKTCACRIEYIGAGDSEISYCALHEKAEDMYKLLLRLLSAAGKDMISILDEALEITTEINHE